MSPEMKSLVRELGKLLARHDANIGFGEDDGTLAIFIADKADGEVLVFDEAIAAASCERMGDEPVSVDYEWLTEEEP